MKLLCRLTALLLSLAAAFSLFACNPSPDDLLVSPANDALEVNYTNAQDEGYKGFLKKLESFSARLTEKALANGSADKNIAVSPLSVYMALAIATECSLTETREEILSALGMTYAEVVEYTSVLYGFSNRDYYFHGMLGNKSVSATIKLNNSLWADKAVKLNGSAIERLTSDYNCDLFAADFKSEAEGAIKQYIKDKTNGLIDGDIQLSPETLFTIINTVYLKEIWNEDGDKLSFTTKNYDFKNANGSTTSLPLLCGYYNPGKYYEGEGFKSFYTVTEHNYKIKFILPEDGRELSELMSDENLYEVNALTDYKSVDDENRQIHNTRVLFPEYEAEFDGDLKAALSELGIEKLFKLKECDMSNLTANTPLYCESVIHKCKLEVNARGIEGAAITAMPMAGDAGPGEYEQVYHDFIIDRAFGFILTDEFNTVIFAGVVNSL